MGEAAKELWAKLGSTCEQATACSVCSGGEARQGHVSPDPTGEGCARGHWKQAARLRPREGKGVTAVLMGFLRGDEGVWDEWRRSHSL